MTERICLTREKLVEKYKLHLNRKGGIFTTKTRGNLLGISVKGRKIRDQNYDFRYDLRNQVKTALVDLELFLEAADVDDVDEIITKETLKPVVKALLPNNVASLMIAEIAQMFIEASFEYLTTAYMDINYPLLYDEIVKKALELSDLLVGQYAAIPYRRDSIYIKEGKK